MLFRSDLIDEYSDLNEIAEKVGDALTAAFGTPKAENGAGEA